MQKDQKAKFENHIRKQIEILKSNILSYEELTKPVVPDNAIGRLTRMEAISSKRRSQEALRKARRTLSRLERASRIIDDPDFGSCREGGEPIAFAGLMIMPETKRCVFNVLEGTADRRFLSET